MNPVQKKSICSGAQPGLPRREFQWTLQDVRFKASFLIHRRPVCGKRARSILKATASSGQLRCPNHHAMSRRCAAINGSGFVFALSDPFHQHGSAGSRCRNRFWRQLQPAAFRKLVLLKPMNPMASGWLCTRQTAELRYAGKPVSWRCQAVQVRW
jgi:hypothetical protein